MMQSLRDNMKLVIWITAIAFLVGFGILQLGGVLDDNPMQRHSGVIARINGEPVRLEEYNRVVQQMTQQLTSQRPLQEGEDSYIREQAWQQIVSMKLMEQQAKARHIDITPEEIKSAIRLTPPDFVMKAPIFLTDGQFDYRKYLSEMDNPNSQVPWAQVEAIVASQLPAQKLQTDVIQGAKVSDGDVRDRFLLQNEKLSLHFVAFDPDSFPIDTARVGAADVESYYKAHPEKFTGPKQVKIQVVLIPRVPNDSDFSAARERLQGILEQVRALPDSFPMYARTYSEIGSAAEGGDPRGEPYFEEMRPTFRNGLRNVIAGQISPIIKEERSLHIFRVDRRYPDPVTGRERIKYHEIAVRVQPGADAIRAIRSQVADIGKEAKSQGLAAVATKRGLRTFQSQYFAEGMSQNSLFDRFPEIEQWCFSARINSISHPIPTEAGWYLYQILDRREPGLRSLQQVAGEAKEALIRSLKEARAQEVAKQALAAVQTGAKPEDVAKQYRGSSDTAVDVTRNGAMGRLGVDPKAVGQLLNVPDQSWSPVITGQMAVFIAHIDSHVRPTEEQYESQKVAIRQSLMNERRRVVFDEWMQQVRREAKIEDFREDYFEA
ncbi:MAG TPA: SurA N-terminal domain-containing protein [Candidatus Eisenbacteria bacterium]|nr:SurA N-terminal domain-containing protein [Candidatus Eisenbacteria bacterium]